MDLNGLINLDKPAGMSSARAVSTVKRLLPRGTKIGHAGTLDPFATGVLLLLVGKGTKRCESLMDEPKQYEATVKLGATTATDDLESPENPFPAARAPVREEVDAALRQFLGNIQQQPPVFSALKVGGRRAYDLARKGQEVVLEPRNVRVDGIDVLEYAWPLLRLRVDCGRGTYIRSLARDLGAALGSGGYLTALRRTRIGRFTAADALTPEQVAERGVESCLHALTEI